MNLTSITIFSVLFECSTFFIRKIASHFPYNTLDHEFIIENDPAYNLPQRNTWGRQLITF